MTQPGLPPVGTSRRAYELGREAGEAVARGEPEPANPYATISYRSGGLFLSAWWTTGYQHGLIDARAMNATG